MWLLVVVGNTLSARCFNARDIKDPHYVDLVRTADLTRDKCWLDEKGQFHLRIRALLPVDDDKFVQTTKGLDLSQDAFLSGKMHNVSCS